MSRKDILNESILLDSIPDLKRVHLFEEIESTNDFAKQLSVGDDQLPALIYARRQTKGRGRGNKKWLSDGGSLTFSFVLPAIDISNPSQSSIVWGTALAQSLNELTGQKDVFKIKWPNDVMASQSKIAGILIETVIGQASKQVVGIGVNLTNDSSHLVPDSEKEIIQAISVKEATGVEVDAHQLLSKLWGNYVCYSSMVMSDLLSEFRSIDFLTSKVLQFQIGDSVVTGSYQGVADDGSIRLLVNNEMVQYQSGSVLDISSC